MSGCGRDGGTIPPVTCDHGYRTVTEEIHDERGRLWFRERIERCPICPKGKVVSIWSEGSEEDEKRISGFDAFRSWT